MSAPIDPHRAARIETVAVILILALALGLRLSFLKTNSLWTDEVYSLSVAARPLDRFVELLPSEDHPPLYYIVARGVYALTGGAWWSVRLASLLFAAPGIVALWLAGRAAFGQRVGLCLLALTAFSPFHLHYSLEGRSYSAAMLGVSLMLLGAAHLWRADAEGRPLRRSAILYGFGGLVALFANNLTLFVVFWSGATQIASAFVTRRWLLGRWLVVLHMVLALLFGAWLLRTLDRHGNWKAHYNWMPAPTPASVLETLGRALPFGVHHPVINEGGNEPLPVRRTKRTLAVIGVLVLVGAWQARRLRPERRAQVLMAVAMVVGPLATTYVLSAYYVRMFYPPRYPVLWLPAFLVLLSWAIASLKPRWVAAVALGALLALQVRICIGYIAHPMGHETKQVLERAASIVPPGEPLYYTTDMEWSVREIEVHAAALVPPLRVAPLWELFLSLDDSSTASLPARIAVLDWSARDDPSSGKRGAYALDVVRAQARVVTPVYRPIFSSDPLMLALHAGIDWSAVTQVRAQYMAPWRQALGLPWHLIRDGGGAELIERMGFSSPSIAPELLARLLQGGHSSWYINPVEPALEVADYWMVLSVDVPAELPESERWLHLSVTYAPGTDFSLMPGENVLVAPFSLGPEGHRTIMHVDLRYGVGAGGEGPRLQWYGVIRRDRASAATLAELCRSK